MVFRGWSASSQPSCSRPTGRSAARTYYYPAMVTVVVAASALLYFFFDAFAAFIDIVTITGFLAAPIVAWANQLVIRGR